MSDTEGSSAALDGVSDVGQESKKDQASGKDQVSHETYKRTVGEVKRLKEQLKESQALKDRLAEFEQNEQMRAGKHEETIQSLRAELDKTKKSERSVFQKYAYKSLGSQVREEAMKHGCVDPNALMKLADLSDVEVDAETFEADKEKIAEIVSSMKTSSPYLFTKAAPKVNGKMPSGEDVGSKKEIDFKKMTAGEITEWLNKNR
jgi:hypothetical protein